MGLHAVHAVGMMHAIRLMHDIGVLSTIGGMCGVLSRWKSLVGLSMSERRSLRKTIMANRLSPRCTHFLRRRVLANTLLRRFGSSGYRRRL